MYVLLNNDNRIACTSENKLGAGDFFYLFPDDFDFNIQFRYKIVDGELVYDPLPAPTPIPTPQEQTDALMLDHEERLIYLELGVNDNAVSGS